MLSAVSNAAAIWSASRISHETVSTLAPIASIAACPASRCSGLRLAITMSATPPRLGAPARRPGSDAAQVLERVGLDGELADLERRWVLQTADLPAGWVS